MVASLFVLRPILKTCFPKNGGFACLATLLSSRSCEVHCNVHLEIIANKTKFGIGNIRFQVSVRRSIERPIALTICT